MTSILFFHSILTMNFTLCSFVHWCTHHWISSVLDSSAANRSVRIHDHGHLFELLWIICLFVFFSLFHFNSLQKLVHNRIFKYSIRNDEFQSRFTAIMQLCRTLSVHSIDETNNYKTLQNGFVSLNWFVVDIAYSLFASRLWRCAPDPQLSRRTCIKLLRPKWMVFCVCVCVSSCVLGQPSTPALCLFLARSYNNNLSFLLSMWCKKILINANITML